MNKAHRLIFYCDLSAVDEALGIFQSSLLAKIAVIFNWQKVLSINEDPVVYLRSPVWDFGGGSWA